MVYIYILKLENEKYYIGRTSNPKIRLENHFNNSGSEWTKKYKPISVIKVIPDCDNYDEDKYTKIYMDKYGIDNVRGGSYSTIYLDTSTRNHLIKISNSTNDRCYKCGEKGHFIKDCHMNDNIEDDYESDDDIIWYCEYCDKIFDNEEKCSYHIKHCNKKNKSKCCCLRCGRNSHYTSCCYASKHIKGHYIEKI